MNLEEYREMMASQAEYDKQKNQAQITASTLQEALKQASIELSLPLKNISYEILQKGRKGVFGVGYQECVIIAYESERKKSSVAAASLTDLMSEKSEEEIVPDRNGVVAVRCMNERVFLRVRAPSGNGYPATLADVEKLLRRRGIGKYDVGVIEEALLSMDEKEYVIGSFFHNNASDGDVEITLSEDDMEAYILFHEPGPGGEDVSENGILQYVGEMNVVFGIDKEKLIDFLHFPVYGTALPFASGRKPVHGKDAKIQYHFETDKSKMLPKEVDGKVDYRSMNLIQNVTEGDVLAEKIPAEKGTPGMTVTGRELEARNGADISLSPGDNVTLSEDKSKLIAMLNGQVLRSDTGKVSVAPVLVVSGDVNIKTGGNIDFIGSVVVRGSVEDGFSIKATKNIEIHGSVGKCSIESDGDISVSNGISGKEGEGSVYCKGALYSKFIQNAKIFSAGDVVVRDYIINANVDTNSGIICIDGKKATITGGHIRASKSVIVKTLGSVSGTETIIEVGFEPEKRARYQELQKFIEDANKEIAEISLNLSTFDKNPNAKANLSSDKLENLTNMRAKRTELNQQLNAYMDEYDRIKEYLENIRNEGTVSVAGVVYPGVRINISGAELKIKNETKWVTYYKEGAVVKMKEYSEKK